MGQGNKRGGRKVEREGYGSEGRARVKDKGWGGEYLVEEVRDIYR